MDDFICRHQSKWMGRVAMDGHTLGVLALLDLPMVIKSRNMLTTYDDVAVNNTCAINPADIQLLLGIVERLSNNVRGVIL